MKILAVVGLIFLSGQALAEIMPQGDVDYKCQTKGGFFDFSPAGAIASCRKEIDEFGKTKNAPPIIGKVTGVLSGYGVYARAEINFQCASAEDLFQRQKSVAEAQSQQVKLDVESFKKTCQQDFDFTPGTFEFGSCLMELQKQLFADRRAGKDRAAQNDIFEAQIAEQRRADSERAAASAIDSIQQMVPRAPTRTNCTTYGSRTDCTTATAASIWRHGKRVASTAAKGSNKIDHGVNAAAGKVDFLHTKSLRKYLYH